MDTRIPGMETDKNSIFDKEGVRLSLGAIFLGTLLYTIFELIMSKGKFTETTVYKIPTEAPSGIAMLIEDSELFPSKKDRLCDKLRDKLSTSYKMRTEYITEERPDPISLYSYLNSLNAADAAVEVEFRQNDCLNHGRRLATNTLTSSIEEFLSVIKMSYPEAYKMLDTLNLLKK